MVDLVQWLTACLDEDERIARAAGGATWLEFSEGGWVYAAPAPMTEWKGPGDDGHHVASVRLASERAHILHHDPARVLREIDAKRQILAECAYWHDKLAREAVDPSPVPFPALGEVLDAVTPILRALALPYADRPGYLEEWKP